MASKQNIDSEGEDHSLKSDSKIGDAWNPKKKPPRHGAGDEIMTIHSSDDDDKENLKEDDDSSEDERSEHVTVMESKDSDNEHGSHRKESKRHISEDDSDNQHFIGSQDLPRLPRTEPSARGNYFGSFHRYEKPISNFKLRVRLLKYPSLTQRSKWGDNLRVLEDRVLSWQEKVFSKTEVAYLMDKTNVTTSLDEKYRREILSNKDSVGKYFYTYVESDFGMDNLDRRSVVHRCAALHSKKSRKFNSSTADKSVNSDGESVIDDPSDGDEYQRSLISKKNILSSEGSLRDILTPGGGVSGSVENLSEETLKTLRKKKDGERLHREKQMKRDTDEKSKIEREEKLKKEKEVMEAIKKGRRELKEDLKQKRFKELERRKKAKDDEYMKMWAGSKRPSLALEAHMKLGMTPTKTPKLIKKRKASILSKRKGKSFDSETNGEEEEVEWNTQDEENESDGDTSKKEGKLPKGKKGESRKKSTEVEIEEILEPPSSRKSARKGKAKAASGGDHSEPGVEEDTDKKDKVGKSKIIQTGYKYSQSRFVRSKSRSLWRFGRSFSTGISTLVEHPQSMIVKVVVPHMTKRRRDLTLCIIKVYSQSGAVTLKPYFGYRIIEAKRNHVYRVSWELYSDPDVSPKELSFSKSGRETRIMDESDVNVLHKEEFLFGDIGDMFEVVPLNEMRLVVMGEILSAKGFEDWPICVHYIVEIPKGWRNDSVASNLQGITHNSYTDPENVAHFSHDFFFQLALSLDSIEKGKMAPTPLILFMVVSIVSSTRVKYEGYGYIAVPSQPGIHHLEIKTWKPKPRTVLEKMNKCFLNISPSLQDMRAVHIPYFEDEDCQRANRLGLETEPSGSIMLRLNIIRQTPSFIRDQKSKLELLEKMSSSTILKSVQAVIDAFQRARNRAMKVKNIRSENKHVL